MESWLTSSVKARESALISRRYGEHGAFLELLCCNWCSSRLEMDVSGNLWTCLSEVKPLVMYDVEGGMALEPKQGNRASSPVDLGYTVFFHIPVVTSLSF